MCTHHESWWNSRKKREKQAMTYFLQSYGFQGVQSSFRRKKVSLFSLSVFLFRPGDCQLVLASQLPRALSFTSFIHVTRERLMWQSICWPLNSPAHSKSRSPSMNTNHMPLSRVTKQCHSLRG